MRTLGPQMTNLGGLFRGVSGVVHVSKVILGLRFVLMEVLQVILRELKRYCCENEQRI